MSRRRCTLCVLAAASLWGGMGIFLNILAGLGLTTIQVAAARIAVAALVLTAVTAARNVRLLRIEARDLWMFAGTGIFSMVMFSWCYFGAIRESNLSVAAVLLYTSPIFVTLLSAALFGEGLTRRKLTALALTFLGCVLVTELLGGGGVISAWGIALGLGAGLGYALYSVFGRFALRKYHTLTVITWTFLVAAAASVPLSLGGAGDIRVLLTPLGLTGLFGVSIICCVLPYLLYTTGLSGMESGRAAIMATVEPVVATALGMAVYHERMTVSKFTGMLLIFSALLLLSREKTKV